MRTIYSLMLIGSFGLGFVLITGCGSSPSAPAASGPSEEKQASHDDHSGWWCAEHGVPEEECALCDTSLVADFKSKGDWCEEHHRPESQCFACNPKRAEKFAARYEAKYGKAPPQPME